jgi:hypothetical protein
MLKTPVTMMMSCPTDRTKDSQKGQAIIDSKWIALSASDLTNEMN